MAAQRSPADIDVPGVLLLTQLGLFILMEGIGGFFALGIGGKLGSAVGSGITAQMVGALGLLFCYGVGKTWLNVRLLAKEYRGDLDFRFGHRRVPIVFPRETLKAVVWGGSDPPGQNDSPSKTADPGLLAGAGLGLPLLVLGGLSVSGNPYLAFVIPVVAFGVYYGVRRVGAESIRPRPYHLGLALTLTYSSLPIAAALVLFLSWANIPEFLDVLPYSVHYHLTYSPLHVVLLPLAMFPMVYVSNYCLLLAYDGHRTNVSFCQNCGAEVDEIADSCPTCEDDSTGATGASSPAATEMEASSGGGQTTEPPQTDEYIPWSERDSAAEMEPSEIEEIETVLDDVLYIIVGAVILAPVVLLAEVEPWLLVVLGVALIAGRIAYWRGLPEIASEDTETTTDATFRDGGRSRLLWALAPLVPVNAVILAWASGFRPIAAVAAAVVPLVILGVVAIIDGVEIRFRDAGTLVAGAVGGLLGCAMVYAVPLVLAPAGPYRYVLWLPVAALVGFVTGVLLHAAFEVRRLESGPGLFTGR